MDQKYRIRKTERSNVMTRKDKGIGFLISGAAFILLGVINVVVEVTPEWVTVVLDVVALMAGYLGYRFVRPE